MSMRKLLRKTECCGLSFGGALLKNFGMVADEVFTLNQDAVSGWNFTLKGKNTYMAFYVRGFFG